MKKVKVTVYWEDDFIREAKALAKSKGISLSRLVEESMALRFRRENIEFEDEE